MPLKKLWLEIVAEIGALPLGCVVCERAQPLVPPKAVEEDEDEDEEEEETEEGEGEEEGHVVSSANELILLCDPLQLFPDDIFTEQLIIS